MTGDSQQRRSSPDLNGVGERTALGLVNMPGWETARLLSDKLTTWIFRGQEDASWPLSTSIERAALAFRSFPRFMKDRERRIVRHFRRRANHYLQASPEGETGVEWLSLIQHFGGPTRLLDFTRSFYVSAFFAVERAASESAIWCVNFYRTLGEGITARPDLTPDEKVELTTALVNESIVEGKSEARVLYAEPYRLHERAAVQQGCFLCPCDIEKTFEENLYTGLGHTFPVTPVEITPDDVLRMELEDFNRFDVIKVVVPRYCHWAVLADLKRMGLSSASQFPGLDGYARSLTYEMRVYEMIEYILTESDAKQRLKTRVSPAAAGTAPGALNE